MKGKIIFILFSVVVICGCLPQNKTMNNQNSEWLHSFEEMKGKTAIKAEFTDDLDEFENRQIECTLEGKQLLEYVSLINNLSNKKVYCLRGGCTIIYFRGGMAIYLVTHLDDEEGIVVMEDPQGNTRESRELYLFLRKIFSKPKSEIKPPLCNP